MTPAHVKRLQTLAAAKVQDWRNAPHGLRNAARKASDKAVTQALRAENKAKRRKQ